MLRTMRDIVDRSSRVRSGTTSLIGNGASALFALGLVPSLAINPTPAFSRDLSERLKIDTFYIKDSDTRLLTDIELLPQTTEFLRLARNEIYARKGKIFKSPDLIEIFSSRSWYSPRENDPRLTNIEKENIDKISQLEDKRRTAAVPTPLPVFDPNSLKCEPPEFPELQNISDAWNDDFEYEVTESKNADGSRRILISGENINVSMKTMRSLINGVGNPLAGIAEIVFDGRNILVDGTMTFQSAKVIFRGDTVKFTKKAQISLTLKTPTESGVEVVARKVYLPSARRLIFYFLTTKDTREIKLSTEKIYRGNSLLSYDQAVEQIRRSSSDSLKPEHPDTGRILLTGSDALEVWNKQLTELMVWPVHFAAKVKKYHVRSPYGIDSRKFLLNVIERNRENVNSSYITTAGLELAKSQGLLQRNLDSHGYIKEFTPRISLEKIIVSLERASKRLSDFADLDSLIADAHQGKRIDSAKLLALREEMKKNRDNIASEERNIDDALRKSTEIQAVVKQVAESIEQARRQVAARVEEAKRKSENTYQIMVATKIISYGASLLPVAAPVAIGIGTATSIAGDYIARHNSGLHDETVVDTLLRFSDLYNSNVKFYNDLDKTNKAWSALQDQKQKTEGELAKKPEGSSIAGSETPAQPSEDEKKKKQQSVKSYSQRSAEFGSALSELLKQVRVPHPTKVEMTNAEKDDGELQRLLLQQGSLQEQNKQSLGQLAKANAVIAASQSDLIKLTAIETELLTGDVLNDVDLSKWKSLAMSVREDLYDDIQDLFVGAKRAYLYRTGRYVSLNAELLNYPEDRSFRSRTFEPMYPLSDDASLAEIQNRLNRERTKMKASVDALIDSIRRGIDRYLAERTQFQLFPVVITIDSDTVDPSQKDFISKINSEISEQIRGRRILEAKDKFWTRKRSMIPLPAQLRISSSPYPEYFLSASITKIDFEKDADLSGKTIEFQIIHPGFGVVYTSDKCIAFDMRSNDAESRIFRQSLVPPNAQSWSDNFRTARGFGSISDEDLSAYAPPPLHSAYYVTLVVNGDQTLKDFRNQPVVKSVTISFGVRQ